MTYLLKGKPYVVVATGWRQLACGLIAATAVTVTERYAVVKPTDVTPTGTKQVQPYRSRP